MDLFPLYNSIRIAIISTILTFFIGIFLAYQIKKLPNEVKGVFDVILTLPLVLPPTVIGFFLLKTLGPHSFIGHLFDSIPLVMRWYSAIFACVIVSFPLMYRTSRAAFENFDENIIFAGKTLGKSNTWIFWRLIIPNSKNEILAGLILAFSRSLGEYGATSMIAGYIPNKTATISTTIYQFWRIGNDDMAYKWALINIIISFIVLFAMNMFEKNKGK